jgi:hypothetical protein
VDTFSDLKKMAPEKLHRGSEKEDHDAERNLPIGTMSETERRTRDIEFCFPRAEAKHNPCFDEA